MRTKKPRASRGPAAGQIGALVLGGENKRVGQIKHDGLFPSNGDGWPPDC